MKMIWAGQMKHVLDFARWRNSMIRIYANEHTVEWLNAEIERQDDYLANELLKLEALLNEEQEAV